MSISPIDPQDINLITLCVSPDIETLRSLEDALLDYDGAAVIVSHDRFFLDRISTCTLAFESDGEVRALLADDTRERVVPTTQ